MPTVEPGDTHPLRPVDDGDGEQADALGLPPEVLAIFSQLLSDFERSGGASLSLARLSKRTQLRMSTLRRFLSALEEMGIVAVELNDDGTGSVQLLPPPAN